MKQIEVFADIACPFAHAGLRRFVDERRRHGVDAPLLRVRAWPLELVNGTPHSGTHLAPEIDALRVAAAPQLFAGFDAAAFPLTTLPALAAAAAAYRSSPERGEAFSLAVRDALWEHGLDVSDRDVLAHLARELDVPLPADADEGDVHADLAEGRRRGVTGSPHFFTPTGDFFCPSLAISTDGGRMTVSFDEAGLAELMTAIFG